MDQLEQEIKTALKNSLRVVVGKANKALDTYVTAIARDFIRLIEIPMHDRRVKAYKTLLNQLKVVGELQRIELVNASWATVTKIVDSILRALATSLAAAL